MNDFLEDDEHDCSDYCCGSRGEGGEEGEDGNWDGEKAGIDGEWGEED